MQGWAGIPVPGHFREYRPTIPVPKVGNEFSTRIPIPKNWEWNFPLAFPFPKIGNRIFHLHSHSRKLGMEFAISIAVIPENTNIPFPFPKIGNGVFISVPVSKNCGWKFSLAIPFPKFGNGICHSHSRSRSPKSHSRPPLHRKDLKRHKFLGKAS